MAQVEAVASAVRAAMREAEIASPADVHFAQTSTARSGGEARCQRGPDDSTPLQFLRRFSMILSDLLHTKRERRSG
jgi:hypothetical protein